MFALSFILTAMFDASSPFCTNAHNYTLWLFVRWDAVKCANAMDCRLPYVWSDVMVREREYFRIGRCNFSNRYSCSLDVRVAFLSSLTTITKYLWTVRHSEITISTALLLYIAIVHLEIINSFISDWAVSNDIVSLFLHEERSPTKRFVSIQTSLAEFKLHLLFALLAGECKKRELQRRSSICQPSEEFWKKKNRKRNIYTYKHTHIADLSARVNRIARRTRYAPIEWKQIAHLVCVCVCVKKNEKKQVNDMKNAKFKFHFCKRPLNAFSRLLRRRSCFLICSRDENTNKINNGASTSLDSWKCQPIAIQLWVGNRDKKFYKK